MKMKVQFSLIFAFIFIIKNGKCGSSSSSSLDDNTKQSTITSNEAMDRNNKKELFKRNDIKISQNAIGFRSYPIYKMPNIDFMEINQLADSSINIKNTIDYDTSKDDDDIDEIDLFKPYTYQQYQQPIIRTIRTKPDNTQIDSKIEDFSGYFYPKPKNPIEYPERPIKVVTTEGYDYLPPASARSLKL